MTRKTKPVRVMHFADTHFGVETYGRLDPATGLNTRLLDFRRSLCAAIRLALAEGIHLAVFAGDAYKSRDPSQTHQREFAECLQLLTERGVPVVLLTGNHDIPNMRGRAHAIEIYRTLGIANVHVLSHPEMLVVATAAGPVQIAAVPYLLRSALLARDETQGRDAGEIRQAMEARYGEIVRGMAERADPALPTLLLGHFWVNGARLPARKESTFNLNEPQVALEHLALPPFDYVALGHIHRYQDLNRTGRPPIVYAGGTDRMDFGERDEPKGFVLVDLCKGETSYRFVEVAETRPFLEIDVEADGEAPTETILTEIGRHRLRDAIVRLTYHIAQENLPLVREKEIRDALAPAFVVVAVRREVRRDQAARSKILTETLDPAAALSHYLDQSEKGRRRKPALLPYAEALFEALRREEATR